jgi:gamma-glutamyltranspeptidase/glutathione hydrolase
VALESGFPAAVRRELIERGHKLADSLGGFGGYQGIWWDWQADVLHGASESRKDGCAIGY